MRGGGGGGGGSAAQLLCQYVPPNQLYYYVVELFRVRHKKQNAIAKWNGMWNGTWNGIIKVSSTRRHVKCGFLGCMVAILGWS